MMRPWHICALIGLCAAIVLAAMLWLSVTALGLERAQVAAQRHALIEENVRLALWRMDSALAPLIARESARPYRAYSPFHAADQAYTPAFSEIAYGDVLVASPLLADAPPYILLHFQIDAAGTFSSPQAPVDDMRKLAEARHVWPEAIEAAAARLTALRRFVSRAELLAELPAELSEPAEAARAPLPLASGPAPREEQGASSERLSAGQMVRNWMETQARSRTIHQSNVQAANLPEVDHRSLNATGGLLRPVWCRGELVLARRVVFNGAAYVQGCWLDWPEIERWLTSEVADLFLHPRLVPGTSAAADSDGGRSLAALPVVLDPGPLAFDPVTAESPVWLSLTIAWVCVLLAASAVVVLLLGLVVLSERRGAFVSAVTHELRTPLTTFRLYTDMLADGMVADADKQRQYLRTLHAEATRLGHLVENVLAYARLERGRTATRAEDLPLPELLQRVHERLADRADQAGMRLVAEPLDEDLKIATVRADASAVEQILFNLVDNACKYAVGAESKQIHLSAERAGAAIALRVRDCGPGVSDSERRRLFRPFHKSARDAAHTAPGVGLGLALSRRLARRLGGDLRLASVPGPGACFELTLRAGANGS